MVLTALFLLSAAFAVLSIAVLFSQAASGQDTLLALGASGLAVTLCVTRHAYLVRFGRLGLLKPKLNWKPLTPDARQAEIASSLFVGRIDRLSKIQGKTPADDIHLLVEKEMLKIKELGLDRLDRSDDEFRSEKKLLRFLQLGVEDRTSTPTAELRDVRRKDVFLDMRQTVDTWYAEQRARKEAYDAWLAEARQIDQTQLLKDGWIAFLESLPGPDIQLWHGVATDFHELYGDRLEAAFWIVTQEACDRAIASDFIVGYLNYRLSEDYRDLGKCDTGLERLSRVIEVYNGGGFQSHALKTGTYVGIEMTDTEAADILANYEVAFGLDPLPRPKGLIDSTVHPPDPNAVGYLSPYAFWDDAGLHLRYPGPNWRDAG